MIIINKNVDSFLSLSLYLLLSHFNHTHGMHCLYTFEIQNNNKKENGHRITHLSLEHIIIFAHKNSL